MSKTEILKRIEYLRSQGLRNDAIDVWSKYKDQITDEEFNIAYERGMEDCVEDEA